MLYLMIRTVAVQGYRSLRDLLLPLGQLSVITGANGSGKSSVYRSLRLLADAALNSVVASLAREGGLPSTFWAGPETIARGVRQGTYAVEPQAKRKVASLKLGFGGDTYGYSIDLGYPPPPPPAMFGLDPHVKRECIWHGPVYRKASALVDRRNNFVWLATTRDEEPVMLTQHLSDTDSMLASVADPQRAPEMLAVREAVRGWRFYDHFRTDSDSPARAAQIGTFTAVISQLPFRRFSRFGQMKRSPRLLRTLSQAAGFQWKRRMGVSSCGCSNTDCFGHFPPRSCRMERCATSYGLLLCLVRAHRN
jgi:predicted ATPase